VGVVRVQRDLPRQSTIGAIATTTRFAGAETVVGAVDGRYRLSETWIVSGQAAFSDAQAAAGPSRSGAAYSLFLDRTGRNWGAFLQYQDISPGFRAPLGFVNRVDVRRLFPFIRYTWFPGRHGIVSIRPELSGSLLWDHAGTLQDWETNAELQFELKGQTQLEVGYEETMERFADVEFRKRGMSIRFETAWLDWLETSIGVDRGHEINFFPAGELRPFLADGAEVDAALTVKPTERLRIDGRYLFTRLRAGDDVLDVDPGASIVSNHIWRSRASYQFTRRLSLRAIADYSAVLPDPALIDLEREKRLTADVLLTYQLDPWTAAYIGFTDGYGNLEIDPLFRDRLRPTDSVLHSTGRQLFVKMSYLLRF
jgi:hypothetical protein